MNVRRWSGVIAHIDLPDMDGRTLVRPTGRGLLPRTPALHLPGGTVIGLVVSACWSHERNGVPVERPPLHASGTVHLDPLAADGEEESALLRDLLDFRAVPVSIGIADVPEDYHLTGRADSWTVSYLLLGKNSSWTEPTYIILEPGYGLSADQT